MDTLKYGLEIVEIVWAGVETWGNCTEDRTENHKDRKNQKVMKKQEIKWAIPTHG